MGGSPPHHYAKEWSSLFSEDRNFLEDGSYVEQKRKLGALGDEIGIFLEDFESSIPFSRVDEVQEYCQHIRLVDLKTGTGVAGQRHGVWLDDKSYPSLDGGRFGRDYSNPLSAKALYSFLNLPRYGIENKPDANIRLICIANPTPYDILALAETASFHQVSALRDAIWKYLALQTAIRVRIPHRGYPIFQLEFHVPYFALRTSSPLEECKGTRRSAEPLRKKTDLTFLNAQLPKSQSTSQYCMHEAQISFTICGSDNGRWAGWAFLDNSFDGGDLADYTFPPEGFQEDPISLGELNANHPIWDPREYFLMIVELQMTQVLKEWECLVRVVECSITGYGSQHSSLLSQQSQKPHGYPQDAKQAFNWTQQTLELLRRLLDVISKPIKAWGNFNSCNGDIGYFSFEDSLPDDQKFRNHLSLRAVNEIFENLEGLQDTLLLLEKSCRRLAEALQLRLSLEGYESLQHNGFATELTISILAPITITIAYFSMPPAVVPFKLNPKSFTISIFIIMIAVRVLFVVLCAAPRGHVWRTKVVARIRKWQSDTFGHRGHGGELIGRREPGGSERALGTVAILSTRRAAAARSPDSTTSAFEMNILEV